MKREQQRDKKEMRKLRSDDTEKTEVGKFSMKIANIEKKRNLNKTEFSVKNNKNNRRRTCEVVKREKKEEKEEAEEEQEQEQEQEQEEQEEEEEEQRE